MKFKSIAALILASTLYAGAQQPTPSAQRPARVKPLPVDFNDHEGWKQLFDGASLAGWDGDLKVWSVQDGAIIGQYNTPSDTLDGQTFLLLKDPKPADFELKLEIKLEGTAADSGIQYRSYIAPVVSRPGAPQTLPHDPRWNVGGYQFDFNLTNSIYNGQVVEGGPGSRGIMAYRGQIVRMEDGKPPRMLAELGTTEALGSFYRPNDWNEVHLIARGHELIQIINGHVMAILVDDDATKFKANGIIALQAAGNGSVKISFRNIWLKE